MQEKPKLSLIVFLLCVVASSIGAQGTFQNLDFESANLSSVPSGQAGGFVSINQALPGWSGTAGDVSLTQVLQNNASLSLAEIDILSPNWVYQPGFPVNFNIIQGKYSAVLKTGRGQDTPSLVPVMLEQTGLVPLIAKTVLFDASGSVTAGALTVAFNGEDLPIVPLQAAPNSEQYGVDISRFAGQVGQLSFSDNPVNQNFSGEIVLDSISFSPSAIPEPSIWALLLCGLGFFGLMCHARKARA